MTSAIFRWMQAGVLALLCAALTPAAGAASASAAEPPSKAAASRASAAPDALAQRLCDSLQGLPETRREACCVTSPTGSLSGPCSNALSRSLRDKALTLDPAAVERCAAASARQLEGCDWVTPYMPATPTECRDITRGARTAGARCQSSLECADGLACRGSGAKKPGICVPPGPTGAICGGAVDTLASQLRQTDFESRHPECTGFCLRGRCAPFVAVGGECSSSKQCAPGSHCVARSCVAGPSPKLGEACAGTTCESDLVCIDGRCSPPKKAGEPCSKPLECAAACVRPTGSSEGKCGMLCSAWPPAGYTPPSYSPAKPAPQASPAAAAPAR